MQGWYRALAVVLLAVWGVASVHCKLEVFPVLSALGLDCTVESHASCGDDHDDRPHSHSPTGCENDTCGAVEEDGYRSEDRLVFLPCPALPAVPISGFDEMAFVQRKEASFRAALDPPRYRVEIPLLTCRTAQSPRAPSPA